MNQAQRESEAGGFYKFREGDNKFQILSEPTIQVSRYGYGICYEGAPYCQKETLEKDYQEAIAKAKAAGKSADEIKKIARPNLTKKWMCWAIERGAEVENPNIVILTLPYGVSKSLNEMKNSEEAGFTGWPMPYSINIKAKNAGKKEVEYELIASRKNTEVTEEELADLAKLSPISQILDRMKAKQQEKMGGAQGEGTNPNVPAGAGFDYPKDEINPDDIPF